MHAAQCHYTDQKGDGIAHLSERSATRARASPFS